MSETYKNVRNLHKSMMEEDAIFHLTKQIVFLCVFLFLLNYSELKGGKSKINSHCLFSCCGCNQLLACFYSLTGLGVRGPKAGISRAAFLLEVSGKSQFPRLFQLPEATCTPALLTPCVTPPSFLHHHVSYYHRGRPASL